MDDLLSWLKTYIDKYTRYLGELHTAQTPSFYNSDNGSYSGVA